MWYFSWIPGIGVALCFGINNEMRLAANGRFPRDPANRKRDATNAAPIAVHATGSMQS